MTEKPDKLLLIYIAAAAFLLCAALSVTVCVLFPQFSAYAAAAAAGLFFAAVCYLAALRHATSYTLKDGRLTVTTGVFIRRISCLYMDRVTVVTHYSLPAGVSFCTVRVQGGGALILTGKLSL